MAVNVPVNTGGVFVAATGGSVTGSFGGMIALSGSGAQITGMKYINGYSVVNPGTSYTSYPPAESTISTAFGLPAGTKLELLITSCSLAAGSPAFFYY